MKVVYLDCIGGISGDMLLGALIDAGVDSEALAAGLKTLSLPPWELEVTQTSKSSIAATKVEVIVGGTAAGAAPLVRIPPTDSPLDSPRHQHASHSHSHSHSPSHSPSHSHSPSTEHPHEHEESHSHEPLRDSASPREIPGAHTHTRTFAEVAALIQASALPEEVKTRSVQVFERLAGAEAKVHGTTLEHVHFHEVGAVDSIVDVVGSVYGLHFLGAERIVCSPLPNGRGFVRCAHGMMPIPPPATLELLQGCPLRQVDVEGELVTPTGAALAATLSAEFGPVPAFTVRGSGYGAGTKDFPFPNLLRVIVGEMSGVETAATSVTLIEANLDDLSPQLFEGALEALFKAGALDVWITPIQMKKGRPAQTLSVLAEPQHVDAVVGAFFQTTSTLGVRFSEWRRTCLAREWVEVDTPFGSVRVKIGREGESVRSASPEYADCRRRAEERGVPVRRVHAAATVAAWELARTLETDTESQAAEKSGETECLE